MTQPRQSSIHRRTSETDIQLILNIDGSGRSEINTGIGFFDHMLTALTKHSLFDLNLTVKGDLHIDDHHSVEDTGIALGQAFRQAIGDKKGISRFGQASVPLDEALSEVIIDISGRPYLAWNIPFPTQKIGRMDTELFEEFFRGFVMSSHINLHAILHAGRNSHHIAEATFKATARALRSASEFDMRALNNIPSTKGVL
ncbi:imidazoleglycerol-phosphate dehydratase HisB [Commensalibacter papalotli (ex Servin-Garciduenas et al. 2014)]|uniref:Imidazoleglycerol-phosphate dehydratase n=1 Tax=Commensalibacter papalotli (ex Servin-Garciduenas et al. 2014) TaxID=1208583 RepID=W7E5J2_9PROT|nr:imidazoleglycerol-phosphate dehydratase HisB [Commensalibacter papalotli (ex Servin-Garciduenas et al. 2014)]EUK18356.1 imidazoleglycerol-phosphate dehydratase [Commensalibacter papalotli (ex Servin-Garciduenas et al. 2014)]